MKARMRRTSASIDVTFAEQTGSEETLHNSKSLDICVSESRIDRMRKLLSSPLLRRKPNCNNKSITSMSNSESKVFGVSLELLSHNSSKLSDEPFIPFVITRLCHFIEDSGGLSQEGLFRISGNVKIIDKLKHSFDSTGDAPLETEGDIASASALLKLFLRELPQPLITDTTQYLDAIKNNNNNEETCVYNLKSLVSRLPDENFYTLKYLSSFLNRIALKEENRMTSENLGIVFAPNIFRVSVDNYQGLREQSFANEVVSFFITNHNEIFSEMEYNSNLVDNSCHSLCPLTVEIPDMQVLATNSKYNANNQLDSEIPALLLHNSTIEKHSNRKRKEIKCHLSFSPLRSSSEEKLNESKDKEMRPYNSHENIYEHSFITAVNKLENLNVSNNSSPHPPEAKRRELETNVSHEFDSNKKISQKSRQIYNVHKYEEEIKKIGIFSVNEESLNENKNKNVTEMEENVDSSKENINLIPNNSVLFKTCQPSHSFDERNSRPLLEITPTENLNNRNSNNNSDSGLISSKKHSIDLKGKIPHSDFKTLFQSSDLNEPILSEHRYSWPRSSQESESFASQDHSITTPSITISQFLKKAVSYEAPLSPSAYRSYLSNRDIHLDPTIPPSPPVQQIQIFSSRKDNKQSETVSNLQTVKSMTKRIQSFKKKIKQFEHEFEDEKGFRPSLDEKMCSPNVRLYIIEMNQLKKDLKEFKDDYYMEDCEISPDQLLICEANELSSKKSLNSISEMMKEIERNIEEKRKLANRPEMLEDMSSQQISDEKLILQKSLLRFEAIYGRPTSKAERNIVRPVYERYRTVKRLAAKYLPSKQGSKDSIELQPILEHIAMDFTSPSHSKSEPIVQNQESNDSVVGAIDSIEVNLSSTEINAQTSVKESSNHMQCNNLHEMSLSELNRLLRETRQQKRSLRIVLRNFENDFFKLMGRKVEKEDRINMGSVYSSYKQTKGKLRLLEALVSKHESHIIIQ